MKGTRVSIEYTPLPYGGKKPKESDEGFPPGCALKLYSITVLEMTNESVRLDTSQQQPEQEEKEEEEEEEEETGFQYVEFMPSDICHPPERPKMC